jgi:hypothetical protein
MSLLEVPQTIEEYAQLVEDTLSFWIAVHTDAHTWAEHFWLGKDDEGIGEYLE